MLELATGVAGPYCGSLSRTPCFPAPPLARRTRASFEQRSLDHIAAQDKLQAAGVPAGAVLNAVELLNDPHIQARGTFSYVHAPGVGRGPLGRPAFTLSETPVHPVAPAPGFGEHNDYVLGELLSYEAGRIQDLRDRQIVVDAPVATG